MPLTEKLIHVLDPYQAYKTQSTASSKALRGIYRRRMARLSCARRLTTCQESVVQH